MKEIWKDIPNTDSQYQISNLGRLRSTYRNWRGGNKTKQTKIITPQINKEGYLQAHIKINGKIVTKKLHRFVAQAFIKNEKGYPVVNHIDGDKTNNVVSNLEWATHKKNTEHAIKMGLKKRPVTDIPVAQYSLNGDFITVWPSAYDAANTLNIRHQGISSCANKHNKSYMGYQWVRIDNNCIPSQSISPRIDQKTIINNTRKKIVQLFDDGSYMVWESIRAAANFLKCQPNKIINMVKGHIDNYAYDSTWSYYHNDQDNI